MAGPIEIKFSGKNLLTLIESPPFVKNLFEGCRVANNHEHIPRSAYQGELISDESIRKKIGLARLVEENPGSKVPINPRFFFSIDRSSAEPAEPAVLPLRFTSLGGLYEAAAFDMKGQTPVIFTRCFPFKKNLGTCIHLLGAENLIEEETDHHAGRALYVDAASDPQEPKIIHGLLYQGGGRVGARYENLFELWLRDGPENPHNRFTTALTNFERGLIGNQYISLIHAKNVYDVAQILKEGFSVDAYPFMVSLEKDGTRKNSIEIMRDRETFLHRTYTFD